ncbi:hypothetical protein Salat_1402100 [Sesamum alatum]|uniref:Secreted protein n=1 Tax=Sesamum alatum TaxID=300844 RepID=A0AAE2CLA4_9LAMI|nr:hypothetical protein Salat_1402100 [Sesamum alatum]
MLHNLGVFKAFAGRFLSVLQAFLIGAQCRYACAQFCQGSSSGRLGLPFRRRSNLFPNGVQHTASCSAYSLFQLMSLEGLHGSSAFSDQFPLAARGDLFGLKVSPFPPESSCNCHARFSQVFLLAEVFPTTAATFQQAGGYLHVFQCAAVTIFHVFLADAVPKFG